MFHSQPEVYAQLKQDWLDTLAEGKFEGFDQELIPLLKKFNQLPGVVSFMSCTGHMSNDGLTVSKNHHSFYLTFAFDEQGLNVITNVFDKLREKVESEWPHHSSLYFPSPRSLALSFSVRALASISEPKWWNSGCIALTHKRKSSYRFKYVVESFKEMFDDALSKTIEEL